MFWNRDARTPCEIVADAADDVQVALDKCDEEAWRTSMASLEEDTTLDV